MKNKILGKKESIFIISLLTIVCILLVVQFIISLVSISDVANMMKLLLGGEYFKDFNVLRAVSILMIILILFSLLISFTLLFIKKEEIKRALLITVLTILFLCVIFFFVMRFVTGEEYDVALDSSMNETTDGQINYQIKDDLLNRHIYLLSSIGIVAVIIFTNFHLSNLIFSAVQNDDEKNEGNIEKTEAELELENEINKMKVRLRIKDLEKEYLKLKTKLDE